MNKKKSIILLLSALFTLAPHLHSQAKKPVIMVVPSDNWCLRNNFMIDYDNQGIRVKVPDYRRATMESTDLLMVISKINELMVDRGFPLRNLESTLKSIDNQVADDQLIMSRSGAEMAESPLDLIKRMARADIIMQLTWTVNQSGPKKSVAFNLQGIDSYSDKQIAGASGTGAPSFSSELPVLLEEAVLAHIDNFNVQLQKHFDDIIDNGREVSLRIRRFANFEGDLESEFNGMELGVIIEKWVSENSMNGRFSTTDATANLMMLEQIRIPLYDKSERPLDTRGWVRDLQRMLKSVYQIDSKIITKGLGQVQLVIGEK